MSALENHLARLAEADLDGIDQALVQVRPDSQAVHQDEQRFREIDIEQRFRSGKLEDPAVLEEPVEALLSQLKQVVTETGRQTAAVARLSGAMLPAREN